VSDSERGGLLRAVANIVRFDGEGEPGERAVYCGVLPTGYLAANPAMFP
jgi:hypothetical protein